MPSNNNSSSQASTKASEAAEKTLTVAAAGMGPRTDVGPIEFKLMIRIGTAGWKCKNGAGIV
jgi:hypothetical protein